MKTAVLLLFLASVAWFSLQGKISNRTVEVRGDLRIIKQTIKHFRCKTTRMISNNFGKLSVI